MHPFLGTNGCVKVQYTFPLRYQNQSVITKIYQINGLVHHSHHIYPEIKS